MKAPSDWPLALHQAELEGYRRGLLHGAVRALRLVDSDSGTGEVLRTYLWEALRESPDRDALEAVENER